MGIFLNLLYIFFLNLSGEGLIRSPPRHHKSPSQSRRYRSRRYFQIETNNYKNSVVLMTASTRVRPMTANIRVPPTTVDAFAIMMDPIILQFPVVLEYLE